MDILNKQYKNDHLSENSNNINLNNHTIFFSDTIDETNNINRIIFNTLTAQSFFLMLNMSSLLQTNDDKDFFYKLWQRMLIKMINFLNISLYLPSIINNNNIINEKDLFQIYGMIFSYIKKNKKYYNQLK